MFVDMCRTRTGVRDPSGYMSSEKMQKLLQIKQAQDRKDRFVKLSEAKRKANVRTRPTFDGF